MASATSVVRCRASASVLEVPVTISAFSAARQALGLAENIGIDAVPVLRGKLAGGLFGTQRFVEKGTIDLSPALTSPIAALESYDHLTKTPRFSANGFTRTVKQARQPILTLAHG